MASWALSPLIFPDQAGRLKSTESQSDRVGGLDHLPVGSVLNFTIFCNLCSLLV